MLFKSCEDLMHTHVRPTENKINILPLTDDATKKNIMLYPSI